MAIGHVSERIGIGNLTERGRTRDLKTPVADSETT